MTGAVPLPPAAFRAWFFSVPLETLLPGTRDLPAVTGTAPVGEALLPTPGATRQVCLADGNHASFQLKDDEFPGRLGGLGRWLFRVSLLETRFAEFMDTGLAAIQAGAQRQASLPK